MPGPRRIGVLGGTFDPIHLGHLVVASEVHDALELDTVVLVPAGRPWQKDVRAVTASDQRVLMTELAIIGDPRLRVSRVDVDRPGPTYSVDTARDLRDEFGPDAELYFLIGADALAGVPSWHEVQALLAEVVLVGCVRSGHRLEVPPGLPEDRFAFVETTAIDVSSTLVRDRVRAGVSIRYLVPDPVEQHIREHRLYLDAA